MLKEQWKEYDIFDRVLPASLTDIADRLLLFVAFCQIFIHPYVNNVFGLFFVCCSVNNVFNFTFICNNNLNDNDEYNSFNITSIK